MKCEDIETKIALYASGDLDLGDSAAIGNHISRCPTCAARLGQFKEDLRTLRSLHEDPVDRSDLEAVKRGVMAEIGLKNKSARHLHGLFRPAYVTVAAAASLALLVWWLGTPRTAHAPGGKARLEAGAVRPAGPAASAKHEAIAATSSAGIPNRKSPRTEGRATHNPSKAAVASLPAASKPELLAPAQLQPDDIAIKLETADPNVVIIWLASSKGGEQQ
jgi:anti-sigma factor RsiW